MFSSHRSLLALAAAVPLLLASGVSSSGAPAALTVDVRDYITQTAPGNRLCETPGEFGSSGLCMDGRWVGGSAVGDEFMISYSHGITDWIARDANQPLLVGVVRNSDPSAGGLRCFANPGTSCGAPSTADHPPQAVAMIMNLPVLSGASISHDVAPTPGAFLVHDWQTFDWISVNPNSSPACAQTRLGSVSTRVSAFVADSFDFGGDVGVRTDVLVVEEQQGGHWERYFYVTGLGRVKEEARANDGTWLSHSNRNRIVAGDGDWSGGTMCYQGGAAWQ